MKRKMETQALLGSGFSEEPQFTDPSPTCGKLYGNLCNYGSGFSPGELGLKNSVCQKKEKIQPSLDAKNVKNISSSEDGKCQYANQAAIINTNMSKWVRFDHDCHRPEYCTECERNQQRTRKVVFTSGGDVIINTRASAHTEEDCDNSSFVRDSNNSDDSTMLAWDAKTSSFKLVINVPMVELALFQSNKFHVEIVCSDKVHGGTISSPPFPRSLQSLSCNSDSNIKGGRRRDFEIIERNLNLLRQSGWYWEKVDSEVSFKFDSM